MRRHDESVERLPVTRYAVMLFLLTAVLTGIVAVVLVKNARHSTWQQNATALSGAAHVGASSFGTLQSNLKVQASQLATSLELQRAVITRDQTDLERIAAAHHALITLRTHSVGALPAQPRITSKATISDGRHVLATVTVGLPLGQDVLALLRRTIPLPSHASLALLYNGAITAGGPRGARPVFAGGRTEVGGIAFAAQSAALELPHARLAAIEPVSAIDALSDRYRSLVYLAAIATLAVAGGLASRLARPLASIVGEVAHLSRQAQTDALTGLANRRGLTDRLEAELAHAHDSGKSVSFVLADVDDFKLINDTHGHQTGDYVLREVAKTLAGSVRELDLVARYGGEEFAVVLAGSRLPDGVRVAEKMRKAIHEITVGGPAGEDAHLTMSFGVAEFPTYPGVDALVAAADAALYQAKRSGKDQVASSTVEARPDRPVVGVSAGIAGADSGSL
jgi:diguanylate cyclase (GGDEF)-like protein